MSDQIRISPEKMRGRAKEYRAEADKVNDVIRKMDSLLDALQSEWEGSASEAYAGRYKELRRGFVKANELIREIAGSLDSTAKIMEETNQKIASKYAGG